MEREIRLFNLREPTKRVLDMLDEFDVTATFFVVADVVDHYPGLMESIAERGREVGCHGLHRACKIYPKIKKCYGKETPFYISHGYSFIVSKIKRTSIKL